jgi:hypothetical protein
VWRVDNWCRLAPAAIGDCLRSNEVLDRTTPAH